MDKNTDKKSFTIVDNAILRDQELGLKKRGLLVKLLSLPPNWDYSMSGFAHILPEGLHSVRTTVHKLEEAGYLKRKKIPGKNGLLNKCQWIINTNPNQKE